MIKKIAFLVISLCLFVALTSCTAPQAEPTTPNTYLPTVMVDGKLYRSTFQKLAEDEAPSEVTGTISSTVLLSQLPEENGQANFDAPDAPYALTDAGLAVFWNEEWVLFATDDRQDAPAAEQHSDVVPLTFPEEASDSVPGNNYGTEAGWNWTFQNLSGDEILSLFGEENELLLGGASVDGLDDLSAEGYFDTEGIAQNMTVQGWPDLATAGGDVFHPLFKIDLFRRDSKLYRTETPGKNAHAAENVVFGVPVRVYWAKSPKSDADTFYYAIFETDELAVYCSTISTGQQDEESAKTLLSRIVWQCLAPDGGVSLGKEN